MATNFCTSHVTVETQKNLQTKWKNKQEKITIHKKGHLTFTIMSSYYKLLSGNKGLWF